MTVYLSRLAVYLGVYREFFKCSLSEATSFRANFLFLFLLGCIGQGCIFYGIFTIYESIEHVGGWNRDTFFFFASYIIVVTELHNTFVTRNYWEMYSLITQGNLDFLLLKPVHPILPTFFRYCRIANFLLLPIPLALLVYFGCTIHLSLFDWCLLPLLLCLSFTLISLIGISFCCFVFWSYQVAGVNLLRIQAQELGSWPDYLFLGSWRFVFSYVVPVLLIGSAPVRFLLNSSDYTALLAMVLVCVLLMYFIHCIWNRGIIQYESASS